MSLRPVCDRLNEELEKAFNIKEFKVITDTYECTIDYVRKDTYDEAIKKYWFVLRGSIWVNEKEHYTVGDVVVPLSKAESKAREIEELGCKLLPTTFGFTGEYTAVHKYKDYGVAHIHFECKNITPESVRKLLRIMLE